MAPYPNGQRKRTQTPFSVGSNPTGVTITRQSGLPKVVNTDLLVKLPPAQPNIQASFFTALLEACDMWLSGKRLTV